MAHKKTRVCGRKLTRRQHTSQRCEGSTTANTATTSDDSLRNTAVLSVINGLVTFTCLLILLATLANYRESRFDELKRLFTDMLPFVVAAVVGKMIISQLTLQRISQDDGRNTRQLILFIRIRSILTILLLGACVYPAVQISGSPQRLAVFLTTLIPQMTSTIKPYLVTFISWVISGILGWIGDIFLGAMGSGLWYWIHTRMKSKEIGS